MIVDRWKHLSLSLELQHRTLLSRAPSLQEAVRPWSQAWILSPETVHLTVPKLNKIVLGDLMVIMGSTDGIWVFLLLWQAIGNVKQNSENQFSKICENLKWKRSWELPRHEDRIKPSRRKPQKHRKYHGMWKTCSVLNQRTAGSQSHDWGLTN